MTVSRASTCSRQRAQTRSRDRGVRTISEGLRKAHNTKNRQSQLSSEATARHQDGAATFRLNEATTTAVIRTREVLVVNALFFHLRRISGRRHVTEASNTLDRQVINPTGNHEVSLAQAQLIHALFDRNSRGRTRRNRVHHLAVATDIRLHNVRCHNVWQCFLQNVIRTWLRKQLIQVQRAHGLHAAHTGALGGANAGWVHVAEQLSWAKARSQESIDGTNQVPQRNTVEVVNHVSRNAVDTWVKALGYLAADKAGHRYAARYAHLGTSRAGNLPFFAVEVRSCTLHISDEGACGFLVLHGKGHVALEVDGGQLRCEVIDHRHVRAIVVVVFTHADIRQNFVVEAVVDVFFGYFLSVSIKPGTSSLVPSNQASSPRQFDDTSSAEVTGHFHFKAGTRGANRSNFASTDDDHHVIKFLAHTRKVRGGPLDALTDIRQSAQLRDLSCVFG